jgi:hypothetical protein
VVGGQRNPTAAQIAAIGVSTIMNALINDIAEWVVQQFDLTEKTGAAKDGCIFGRP